MTLLTLSSRQLAPLPSASLRWRKTRRRRRAPPHIPKEVASLMTANRTRTSDEIRSRSDPLRHPEERKPSLSDAGRRGDHEKNVGWRGNELHGTSRPRSKVSDVDHRCGWRDL